MFRSGPAVIVYNERGHRIEDDDIDTYPEDDQSALNGGRSDRRSEPVSRSRTPVEPYYPPGGSSSRRTSNSGIPDATRIERTASKGYSPSIAPSTRSAAYSTRDIPRGSDGERTGSDSERKKGKDREREYGIEDRDRGFTPTGDRNRNSVYGAPSIAKVASSNGGGQGPEMLSSGWGAPPSVGYPSSRSPSIRHPRSGSASIYGGGEGHFDQSTPQDFASPPKSAVDEHRQSHLWDAPQSAALDAILDRPSSPYVDRPKSPYAQDNTFDRPKSPFGAVHAERSSSPFVHGPSAIGRSASPFVDRPKSGVEGSFFGNSDIPSAANFDDRPPAIFGDDRPPSVFGNSGLAANDGGPALFGEPPASVFGETAAVDDSWGFQPAATTATSSPTTTKAGKSKRKGSAAASPAVVATPASGLASRNSPFFGANKSPFGRQSDFATYEEPVVAAAVTSSPTTGLWGSKAPSPFEKKERGLSPLNPASQIHNEPAAANDASGWDFKPASGGDDGWGNANLDDPYLQEARVPSRTPSRAPSPAPPVRIASPVPPTPAPVEEPVAESPVVETSTTKKKKKKTAAKSPAAFAQDAPEQEEEERKRVEAEKHANEEKERLEKEEAERQVQEEREMAEREKLRKELEKLEADQEADRLAAEMAEKERQEEEKAKVATVPSSLFGNNTSIFSSGGLLSSSSLNPPDKPWISTDTGGGDDAWGGGGGGWGGTTVTTKKKKGSKATTPITPSTTKPSMFSSTGWGSFGGGIGDSSSPVAAPSPRPSPKPLPSELPSSQGHEIFDFGSTGPNLSFSGFEPPQQKSRGPSRAASPAPPAEYPLASSEGAPLDITSPIPDSGEAEAGPLDGEGEGAKGDEEEGALASGPKKKKKKKAGEPSKEETPTPATPQEETGAETVNEATIEPAATAAGGKKKKKKK